MSSRDIQCATKHIVYSSPLLLPIDGPPIQWTLGADTDQAFVSAISR
jgi:hypothetical protein